MSVKYERLKTLLKELFQLDQPELDFGLYRVMHARSAEVSQFLDQDLLPQIKEEFDQYKTADTAELQQELSRVIVGIEAAGMNPDDSPTVTDLRNRIRSNTAGYEALEDDVYDHLFGFFRRYYSDGDFVAKRVYKPGVYAIPYEGEEVTIHWANKNQHYVKTSEYLRDYTFCLKPGVSSNPMRVHFRLVDAAQGEHGNVRAITGKDRKFILAGAGDSGYDFIVEEEGDQGKELVVCFEYRSATLADWSKSKEGHYAGSTSPSQRELNVITANSILSVEAPELTRWITELCRIDPTEKEPDRTVLSKHLRKYCSVNEFDYFVHKDLGAFLRLELDFYIKNEVLHLDDVESESLRRVEQHLAKIKVVRTVARKIISFLAQLEDFQRRLWLKRKFVVETQYCITLDLIPTEFFPEIAANEKQRQEWVRLFAIDNIEGDLTGPPYSEPLTVRFLETHRMLPIDTRLFDAEFKSRVVDSISDLSEILSGVLIHGENQQAARLISRVFARQAKCIYFDPPYNTSDETFIYKNRYRHSSWLSMIRERAEETIQLMSEDAIFMITIDDEEAFRLKMLLDDLFGAERFIGAVVVQSNPRGRGINSFFATSHEYCLCYAADPSIARVVDQPLTHDQAGAFRHADHGSRFRLLPFRRSGGLSTPDDRPNSEYVIYYSPIEKKIRGIGGARLRPFPAVYEPAEVHALTSDNEFVIQGVQEFLAVTRDEIVSIFPTDKSGGRRVWRWSNRQKVMEAVRAGDLVVQEHDGSFTVYLKDRIKDGRKPKTVWSDARYDSSSHGTNLIAELFGERGRFGYPKSLYSTRDAIHAVVGDDRDALVVDLFGGSGTTAHAVIDLNRDDDGSRRFVLVEAERYFDTVMLPRVMKAAYAQDWRGGKPVSRVTSMSLCLKYLRLESYEDALNNLEAKRSDQQQLLLDSIDAGGRDAFREQYLLRYMLEVETRGSQSLLNVRAFADPTSYKLRVKWYGSDESREVDVDLVETFNWLIGLTVRHIGARRSSAAYSSATPKTAFV